jgi:hypothetical protein
MRAEKAFPHHRAHVPFVRIQLHPIVFIGPNRVTILYWLVSVIRSPEMDSASGLRSRLWSPFASCGASASACSEFLP